MLWYDALKEKRGGFQGLILFQLNLFDSTMRKKDPTFGNIWEKQVRHQTKVDATMATSPLRT